jgi:hypothetical protein
MTASIRNEYILHELPTYHENYVTKFHCKIVKWTHFQMDKKKNFMKLVNDDEDSSKLSHIKNNSVKVQMFPHHNIH